METHDHVIIWEAPKIEKPEFRLYYDDNGKVICYTCEKLPGQYIIIDAVSFAESRPDVRVLDGKLIRTSEIQVISKLVPSLDSPTVYCHEDDIAIIVSMDCKQKKGWKYKTYEL